jgi:PAS domain S-box-containing protein
MGLYAFTQAFLCGFFGFVAIASLVMWWRASRDLSLLAIAVGSFIWAAQSIAVAAVAASSTIEEARLAMTLRTVFGALGVAAIAWTFAEITGARARAFVWFCTISMVAVAVAAVAGVPVIGAVAGPEPVALPWSEVFSVYTRTAPLVITFLIYAVILAVDVFTLISALRYMRRDRIGGVLLIVAALGFALTIMSAALIDLFQVKLPNLGMYGVAISIIVIAAQFARTNRHRGEDLAAAHRRFRAIFDQTFQFIGLMAVDGTLLEVNDTALRFASVPPREVIGKKFWDTPWWTHSPDLQIQLREAVSTAAGGQAVRFEATHLGPDGRLHFIDFSLKPVRDSEGNVILLIPEGHDITERVVAEEAKQKLQQQLLQSQKMEALGQLAGGVAHDFNNLLTVIAGHTDLLFKGANAQAQHDLEQIRLACRRAASMTRQLLAFSRQSVLEPKVVDINEVVVQTETLLRRTLGEHIELTVRSEAELRSVKADPDQLSRVLLNMAINARDAMPNGGRFSIETKNVTGPNRDGSRAAVRDYVLLVMSDTGCGISLESKARLFEPFYSTKPQGQGTGLGLAVVDGIVKQSGGWIDVESELNVGTTFQIFLPATDRGVPVDASRFLERPPDRGTETVLLVEDEPAVREMTQRALEAYGYKVVSAYSGEDALQSVSAKQGPINLLLTDVVMPGMSGPELAERVRQDYPSIAVIFMSGHISDAVLRQGIEAGEAHFVQKPFTTTGLATKLRHVLDQH